MKVRKKILSIILAVCILVGIGVVSSNIDKKAEASSSGPYIDSYMTQYFYDLRANLSKNEHGTCAYVSIAMLLSFYDNYLDANIIPDEYENRVYSSVPDFTVGRQSPGVARINTNFINHLGNSDIVYVDTTSPQSYYFGMFDSATKAQIFQAKLFEIAQELDYMTENVSLCDDNTGGLGAISKVQVLQEYLIERGFVLNQDNPFSLAQGEFVVLTSQYAYLGWEERNARNRAFIIEEILKGNPVLVSIATDAVNNEKDYHSVVAYDYDVTTDKIYFHSGYASMGNQNNHISLEEFGYANWATASVLNINTPHVCDNNYVYNGVGYCYHDEEINTYNHTHVFSEYIGYTVVDGTTYHTVQCNGCIEKRTNVTTHHFSNCAYYSTTLHKSTCICGYMQTSAHYVNRLEIQEDAMGRRYAPCMGCGVRVYLDNTIVGGQPWSLGIKYSLNGSQKLPNGIIILEIEDIESYLLGTLRFYNENDLETSVI